MNSVALTGTLRKETGKKATKAIRKSGHVPSVIYGGENPVHFSAATLDYRPLIYTPDFNLAEITIDGDTYKCIVKSATFHPVTDELQHVDFLQLSDDRKFKVELPVKFTGVAPGVKAGGKIIPKLRRVKVKTSLDALVESLTADVSQMELGQSIRVRDIKMPEGMEPLNPLAIPIASVEVPRALKSAQAGVEGAEGEDDEEGEEGAAEAGE